MTEAKVRKVLEDYRNGLPRHGDEGELLSEEDRLDYALASLKELEPKVEEIVDVLYALKFPSYTRVGSRYFSTTKNDDNSVHMALDKSFCRELASAIIEYLNRGR